MGEMKGSRGKMKKITNKQEKRSNILPPITVARWRKWPKRTEQKEQTEAAAGRDEKGAEEKKENTRTRKKATCYHGSLLHICLRKWPKRPNNGNKMKKKHK